MSGKIRTLLVDDQRLVRAGLRMLCEASDDIEVVGEAQDGQQAISMVARLVPDVVLMDLRMPGVDGITATERILADRPAIRILVLTTFDDDEHLYPALAAGACGFLAKDTAPEALLDGVRRAAQGDSPFSPHVLRRLVSRAVASASATAPARPAGTKPTGRPAEVELTNREKDVLALLAAGLSNAEIGERLYISTTTVKTHVASLMAKTKSRNRVQLALSAGHYGIEFPDHSAGRT